VHFALNADGQVLSRVQNDGTSNDPSEYHLFVSGVQIANYTNDSNEDTQNYDYQSLLVSKESPGASGSGRFYQGSSTGTSGAETGTSGYDPINGITAGTSQNSRSRYTVQAGDTLQGIAQNLWGDSSLWYLIADANGLSADAALTAGQGLAVPLKGPSNFNNANMFRPYDAASAVGDLSPTSAKPPKKGKCGAFGQILLVAIAIAVTAIATAGIGALATGAAFSSSLSAVATGSLATLAGSSGVALGAAGAVGVAAAGAAVGSVVSQGIGVATGIQQQFSWRAVALSALSAGIAQGAGSTNLFSKIGIGGNVAGSPFVGNVVRGAVTSAATQGIAVATGIQDKFDWAGVAAAGLSAGVGGAVRGIKGLGSLGTAGGRFVTSMASDIADAATRSVINGSDFGDNLLAALPDIIGQTIGGLIADGESGRGTGDAAANDDEGAAADNEDVGDQDDGNVYFAGPLGLAAANGSIPRAEFLAMIAAAGVDPLAPLPGPDPLAPLPDADPLAPLPAALNTEALAKGMLAESTEVTFQGTQIHEGDILVVGTRRSGSSSLEATIKQIGDIISGGEGGYESYNAGTKGVKGGVVVYSFTRNPPGTVTGKTINQILRTEPMSGYDRRRMFATGKYQTTYDRLRGAKVALGLTGNELDTPELQEQIYREYLFKEAGGGALYDFVVSGQGTVDAAMRAAAHEWASIGLPAGERNVYGVVSNGYTSNYQKPGTNAASITSTNRLRAILVNIARSRTH
jgi:LysM repeat protein